MRTAKTWMGLTAQQLIDGQDGTTKGGDRLTGSVCWTYRTSYDRDGFVLPPDHCTVCAQENADCISIETPGGPVAVLDL